MTDDPKRVDLSDKALFAGIGPPRTDLTAPSPSAGVAAAVELALRAMIAAGLKTEFGWDQTDAERLWASHLSAYGGAAIVTAADDWQRSGTREFPSLSEFETLVASVHRRLHAPPERPEGQPCPECGEYEGQSEHREGRVNLTDPTQGGIGTSRPCSLCRPEQHSLWKAGHFAGRETPSICRCGSPLCPDAKRRARAQRG